MYETNGFRNLFHNLFRIFTGSHTKRKKVLSGDNDPKISKKYDNM